MPKIKASKIVLILGILSLFLVSPNLARADADKGSEASDQGDYQPFIKKLTDAANEGNAEAQYAVGILLRVRPDYYTQAVKMLRLAANQGHAGAQFNLGDMYNNGLGVPEDDTEAVRWYRLAAEQGDAQAQARAWE